MWAFRKRKIDYPDFWTAYEDCFRSKLPTDIDLVRFVVLDTETTGLDLKQDRMLCIGALLLQNGSIPIRECLEVYVDQDAYHAKNIEVHGILKEGPERTTELEAMQLFLAYAGNSVLVGHHVGFDVAMLNEALKRHGLPKLKNRTLDTSELYKRTLIRTNLIEVKTNYSLDELADKFEISKKDRHTALGDALITALVFLKILGKLGKKKDYDLNGLLKTPQWPFR